MMAPVVQILAPAAVAAELQLTLTLAANAPVEVTNCVQVLLPGPDPEAYIVVHPESVYKVVVCVTPLELEKHWIDPLRKAEKPSRG